MQKYPRRPPKKGGSVRRKTAAPAGDAKPGKQIAAETLPTRFSRSEITGGDTLRRTINDYAKAAPADASGAGSVGYNIHSMARN